MMKLKSKYHKQKLIKVFGIIDFTKKSKRWDNVASDPVGDMLSFIAKAQTDSIMQQAKNMAEVNSITIQEAVNRISDAMKNQTKELYELQKQAQYGFVTAQQATEAFSVLGNAFRLHADQFESAVRSINKRKE